MCDLLGSGDEIREDGREHAGAGLDEVCHIDTLRLRDLALSTHIKVQQHNPKRGASRTRYDGYKSATTIDEFLRYGGTYADLANDTDKRRKFVVFVDQPAADLKALLSLEQDVLWIPPSTLTRP